MEAGFEFRGCPDLLAFTAAPVQTSVGGRVDLTVRVRAADGGVVSFEWTATSGQIDHAAEESSVYTCTEAGVQTLTLVVRDSDDCEQRERIQITCI